MHTLESRKNIGEKETEPKCMSTWTLITDFNLIFSISIVITRI